MINTHIIAGCFKNSRILLPDKSITRATMNHVRESVFNILEHRFFSGGLSGLICLDAFAGSGALGLEALSRGVSECIFVENNKTVFPVLCKNFAQITKRKAQDFCINKNILDYAETKRFDLVFLDPPFKNKDIYHEVLNHLKEKKMIHANTIIYIESQKNGPSFAEGNILHERHYGAIKVQFINPTLPN